MQSERQSDNSEKKATVRLMNEAIELAFQIHPGRYSWQALGKFVDDDSPENEPGFCGVEALESGTANIQFRADRSRAPSVLERLDWFKRNHLDPWQVETDMIFHKGYPRLCMTTVALERWIVRLEEKLSVQALPDNTPVRLLAPGLADAVQMAQTGLETYRERYSPTKDKSKLLLLHCLEDIVRLGGE